MVDNMNRRKSNYTYQFFSAFTASICTWVFGMTTNWLTATLPLLERPTSPDNYTSSEISSLAIMSDIGAIPGNLIGFYLSDKFGRKFTMQIGAVPFLLATILIAVTKHKFYYFFARFLMGLSIMMSCMALIPYLGEITSPKFRGRLSGLYSLSFCLGGFLEILLATNLSIQTNAWCLSIFPIIWFVSMLLIPESPYYYLQLNKETKAIEVFDKLNRQVTQQDLNLIHEILDEEQSGTYFDLFYLTHNRKSLLIMITLISTVYLGGSSAINVNAQNIFEQIKFDAITAEHSIVIYSIIMVLAQVLSLIILDKFDRRKIYFFCATVVTVLIIILVLYFDYFMDNHMFAILAYVSFQLLKGVSTFGLDNIVYCVLGEIFPINVKSLANCLLQIFMSVLSVISLKVYQILNDSFGLGSVFFSFLLIVLIGSFLLYFLLVETKGKTLEQIQIELKRK